MSTKVTAIAAGEAHTLALTGHGSVFSWGRGTFGRLGTGKEQDELQPTKIAFPDDSSKFLGVAAGAYHSLALEDDGSVWSWGYNIYGQLGHGEENSSLPCLVQCFQELRSPDSFPDESDTEHQTKPLKISSIKAGGMMSLAIDTHGTLWMWGNCPQPTADMAFRLVSSPTPLPVRDLHGCTVVKVACGSEHIIAAVCYGEVDNGSDLVCYAWGNNNHGQLGLGHNESRPRPEAIPAINQVYEIACGAFHTVLLTRKKSQDQEIETKCWTCGLGDNGQLGHGTTMSKYSLEPVNGLPGDAILISVDCGLFHTSVVSEAGDVWSWGMEKGLGLCPDACFTGNDAGDALSPLRIQFIEGPVQVACGAAHTVLVAGDGYKLWAWGRGGSGILGRRGQTADSFLPCAVTWPPPLEEEFIGKETSEDGEVDRRLYEASEEIVRLQRKLALMERYASVLHVSIFRKALDERALPRLLQDSGAFDLRKELESMMESAETEELARMEMFYRGMLSNVKEKLMKRRVLEMVKECLVSLSTGRQSHSM